MERAGGCSEKDTRTTKKWQYQEPKNTMKMVCASDEGMLRWNKAWRGEGSKLDGKEGKKEMHSKMRN